MPELAEVEIVARQLHQALVGRRVERFQIHNFGKKILFQKSSYPIEGITFRHIRRLGKYVLFEHDQGLLASHLAMTGSWRLGDVQQSAPSLAFVFDFDQGPALAYYDLRHFGKLFVMRELTELASLSAQGPDIFSDAFTASYLKTQLSQKRTTIGATLLDQRIFPGVGNYLKSEVLFKSKIHPQRTANLLSTPELYLIKRNLRHIVRKMLQHGGLSLRDYIDTSGTRGLSAHKLLVYQAKQCTQCHHAIRRIIQAGRSTWYCPQCQKNK